MSSPSGTDAKSYFSIILAGGSGTRLWPLSTQDKPKQFLSLCGDKTLLQETVLRAMEISPPNRIITVTNKHYQDLARSQLTSIHPALAEHLLFEPKRNNTLPAIAWAVAVISQKNPEALITVFPADHAIKETSSFLKSISHALDLANQGFLVTIGIPPTHAETGYGYIHAGAPLDNGFRVASFVEKPKQEVAEKFLAQGGFYWNSGIFCFRASTFENELKKQDPFLYEIIQKLVFSPSDVESLYGSMKNISIDYGLMERAENIAMIPAQFEWTDLGSWQSLYRYMPNQTPVTRPWGTYTVLEEGSGYKIKKIVVDPGQKLSLQKHEHRAEHWVVLEGSAKVTCGEKILEMKPNESTFIPRGEKHRLENPGKDSLVMIEVQTGSYLGEDDIERFDDVYGRVGN